MSTDVASNDDPQYAKKLVILTLFWLVIVFGGGALMVYLLP